MLVTLEDVSSFAGAATPALSLRFKVESETPTTLEVFKGWLLTYTPTNLR
jgi:hypothetical protein